ncbi:glr4324 [Gloeobacter violaceus PCC 7421]|uniref:Glr4324 protein n=1 Tax=Gloeobacter violaceus (strain ATCC 29082 / PCC 7421) TaxID=251221 RepID=Q7NDB2_GLOVI|nr:glr4324 [Gloeobacter violaceus PCC 7421]
MTLHPLILLAVAIASEVIGSSALKLSEGFSRPLPSLLVVLGYGAAFYLLGLTLKAMPLSVVYAIWSGVGTAATAFIGVVLFREVLDAPRLIGIALIIVGVLVLNLSGGGRL